MVMKLYNDTRQDLADILYLWSAQSSIPNIILFRLLSILQTRQVESEAGEGGPDRVTLALIMAVLNAFNFSFLHSRENGEGIIYFNIDMLIYAIFTNFNFISFRIN